MFRVSSAHLQEDTVVYVQHMVLSLCRNKIKCQLNATEVFIADLIAGSTCFGHHYAHYQELKSIIQWLLRVVFCAVVFQVADNIKLHAVLCIVSSII